jgi:hypothetical protein
MPDTAFSDADVGSTVECCRAGPPGASKPRNWTVDAVRKILCKSDPQVVADLSRTKVTTADSIHYDDPYFDGKSWTTKRFEAGGSANPATKEIMVLSGTSAETAATTFYHEVWHQNQPKGMGWPEPAEDDAYLHTEQWTIDQGLPGQQGDDLRMTDPATGKQVPDPAAIRKLVQNDYPSPPAAVAGVAQPVPVSSDPVKNLTQVRDPNTGALSWRPSVKGDTYAGPEVKDNLKTIDPTQWKCP